MWSGQPPPPAFSVPSLPLASLITVGVEAMSTRVFLMSSLVLAYSRKVPATPHLDLGPARCLAVRGTDGPSAVRR